MALGALPLVVGQIYCVDMAVSYARDLFHMEQENLVVSYPVIIYAFSYVQ